jgi:hypothetical protein
MRRSEMARIQQSVGANAEELKQEGKAADLALAVTIVRASLGVAVLALGLYVVYGVTVALHRGTNPLWVAAMAVLAGAMCWLLIRAARQRPAKRVTVRTQLLWIVGGVIGGGWQGSTAGLPGVVVGAGLGALVGALALVAYTPRVPRELRSSRTPLH